MITFHFHLQPQYKYQLFHINFTSFHCTGRYELNKLTLLPMCGFIAQLVEHRTGIAEVTGSNPVEALIFFKLLLSNCLNWKIYCDDHSSLSELFLCSTINISNTFLSAESLADEPKSANLMCPVRSTRTLSGLISLVKRQTQRKINKLTEIKAVIKGCNLIV